MKIISMLVMLLSFNYAYADTAALNFFKSENEKASKVSKLCRYSEGEKYNILATMLDSYQSITGEKRVNFNNQLDFTMANPSKKECAALNKLATSIVNKYRASMEIF